MKRMTTAPSAALYDAATRQLVCQGEWNIAHFPLIQTAYSTISWPQDGTVTFNGKAIVAMDSAGAWLLNHWISALEKKGIKISLEAFSTEHQSLLTIIKQTIKSEEALPVVAKPSWVARVGINTMQAVDEFQEYLTFIGKLAYESLRIASRPSHIRWGAFINVIFRTGYQA